MCNNRCRKAVPILLLLLLAVAGVTGARFDTEKADAVSGDGVLKWVDFTIPASAMERALDIDIDSHGSDSSVDWVELLAVLGTRYGGDWSRYRRTDLDEAAGRLRAGETPGEIVAGYGSYDYYETAYRAVLGGFVGEFQKEVPVPDIPGAMELQNFYGLKAYAPIAEGFGYSHYRDFGNRRSYGYSRPHQGNDLVGSVGTPIIAVEGGVVEELGWNQYGGWRVGIRSHDRKRYYYYAHMRRDRPYAQGLEKGRSVQAGDVIGYLGMTGYSTEENVNGMTIPHLHFGMQLVFEESQKDAPAQIWIDVYDLVELLGRNRATVVRDNDGEYTRKFRMFDRHYAGWD